MITLNYWVILVAFTGFSSLACLAVLIYYHFIGVPSYYKGKQKLGGKTVIITGSNKGIGLETALELAARGARVILACRNIERGKAAETKVIESSGNGNVVFRQVDLSDLDSVRHFATNIINHEPRLDILINNAALGSCEDERTAEGYDLVFSTNHFGHFLLTYLLLDLLKASSPSRIINVTSVMHKLVPRSEREMFDYPQQTLKGYTRSKLANILHVKELARRLEGTGVTANSIHPGAVYSDIWSGLHSEAPSWVPECLVRLFFSIVSTSFWDHKAGAQGTIFCALDDSLETVSGQYFDKGFPSTPSKLAQDDDMARKLWKVSMEVTGLDNYV